MEEQKISFFVTSNPRAPLSDSESSIHQYPVEYAPAPPNNEASCLKPGVVNQLNGLWGAYLCANNGHIWLGSFETEEEATFMAHKSAYIECYDVHPHTPQFWSHSITDEVINMTMDSSYSTNFQNFPMAQIQEKPDSAALHDTFGFNLRRLFMKVLTPSDAGKLNRLVIPKRFAIKHFPPISEDEGVNEDEEVMFFDMSMKLWKFRYCYWNSSQSYVFTRGWNAFLKEKCLKPKDMVIFSAYERSDCLDEVGKLYIIDVSYNNNAGDGQIQDVTDVGDRFSVMGQAGDGGHEDEEIGRMDAQHGPEEKGVKLFGVNIV